MLLHQELTIRRADRADLNALATMMVTFRDFLDQTSPAESELRESLQQLLSDPATDFLLAVSASTAVGYAQCRYRYSAWISGLEMELEDLWVAAEARRQAVGSQLLQEVIRLATERRCRSIAVSTNEHNHAALALYTRFDFHCARPRWNGGRQLWLVRPVAIAAPRQEKTDGRRETGDGS
ncbi:MAG: GNAT family N-acetyltransferase [Deltaproteobacteria bacterium]|nr:GNAT family N-acetyltransferase [Deltaproteobacteria bacterium]